MAQQALAEVGIRLIDEAYFAWFAAARDCEKAHRAWLDGACGTHDAHCAYRAALDREEAAARDLERLSALASACETALGADRVRTDDHPAADTLGPESQRTAR
jgi:hypothetical protein